MIRVCHLITGLEIGGAETSLAQLVSRLDPSRFETKVITLADPGPVADAIRRVGVPVASLHMRRGTPSIRGLVKMIRILRRERPAILQTWLYHADLLGLIAGRLAGISRVVWNVRCSDMRPDGASRSSPWIIPTLSALSWWPDAVVVNSHSGRIVHERLGYRPRRWIRIPNGIDGRRFRPRPAERAALRRALGIPETAPTIGLVARVHPMKDHKTFLLAAAALRRVRPDAAFVMAGKGTEPGSPELGRLVNDLGLSDCVRMLGARTDLENIYPAFDVATLSSAFGEGFSNVLIEAMSCGVPCVATNVGDAAEILGSTGQIVPARDPDALAGAWDETLRGDITALGAAGRARSADFFGIDRVVAAYEAFYADLAEHAVPKASKADAIMR